MRIMCCECGAEIKDPIWYEREILNRMEPEIEYIHPLCMNAWLGSKEEWQECSHMLIASRALRIAADALNAVGQDTRTSNIKNQDGRFFGVFTFATQCDNAKTVLNAKHEQVKRKLVEDLARNSVSRN